MTIEWLGYIEEIEAFTFREKASISIPKRVREKSFSLQVDLRIVSVVGNNYVNFKSVPPFGFYGYVVLVFRNFAEVEVPISQARQRLYYGRVSEAYTNWYQLFLWRKARDWSKGLATVLGQIGEAVGLGDADVPPADCVHWSGFEELPLREVYVKSLYGCQFQIEVSNWSPIIRVDDECIYDGKSGQVDDTSPDGKGKDDGLPPSGSQPRTAPNPNDPFSGLEPPSTSSQLGEYGNNKINNASDPDPNNNPEVPSEGQGTYIFYEWSSLATPPSVIPPTGFPNFQGSFLFDATLTNTYTTGARCDGDVGISYFRNGSPRGCAAASGYRLESLSFVKFV